MQFEKYPRAEVTSALERPDVALCTHCGAGLVVHRWDRWNGFLVECPECGGFHGRRWRPRFVLLASIPLNALSFFFTMRPLRALLAAVAWFVLFFGALLLKPSGADTLETGIFIVFFLGPLVINGALLVRHQVDLDRPPVREGGSAWKL